MRPSVLVIPGGGYEMTSDREAEPIAMQFLAAGFNAFVLRYSVKLPFSSCAVGSCRCDDDDS